MALALLLLCFGLFIKTVPFLEEGFTSELITEQPTAALRILSQFRSGGADDVL